MKKSEFETAQATSAQLRNAKNPITMVINDDRKMAVRYQQVLNLIDELEQERQELEKGILALFETHGYEFAQDGKSTYSAISVRDHNERIYFVCRQGEPQVTVDYKAFATAKGETAETLKAKGFYSMRNGTKKIGSPNQRQLKMLMELFKD